MFRVAYTTFFFHRPAAEERQADYGRQRVRDRERPEDAVLRQPQREGEGRRERELEEPEDPDVDPGRRRRVARPVERLHRHHAPGVEDVAVADDAEGADRHRVRLRVYRERRQNEVREPDEEHRDHGHEQHVPRAGEVDGPLRALRFPRPEVLAHERGRRVREAPRGEDDEDDDADREQVSGQRDGPELGQDADRRDVADLRHEHLADAAEGHTSEPPDHGEVEPDIRSPHAECGPRATCARADRGPRSRAPWS